MERIISEKNGKYLITLDNLVETDIFSQKKEILGSKLEVLAQAIYERLRLSKSNLEKLQKEEVSLDSEIMNVDPLLESKERLGLKNALAGINKEQRSEPVECWRDVTNIMRDFLHVWEDYQKSKARSDFFKDA